jgi:hypothetical protein
MNGTLCEKEIIFAKRDLKFVLFQIRGIDANWYIPWRHK